MLAFTGPDTRYLISRPLWIAEQPHVQVRSLMHDDFPGHFHVTRREAPYGLRARSYKPKVSAYRSTLQLQTPYRATGGISDHETKYNTASEKILFDPAYKDCRTVDDRQANRIRWRRMGQIERSILPQENETLYRSHYPIKTPEPVQRVTMKHIPLKTEQGFANNSVYKTDFANVKVPCKCYPTPLQRIHSNSSGRQSTVPIVNAKLEGNLTSIHETERGTNSPVNKSSYEIDYQKYLPPTNRVPLLTRRIAPKVFARPVTNPPFEIAEFDANNFKSSYREHYKTTNDPKRQCLPAAGSITRGGRLISQRETYPYYCTPTPVLRLPCAQSVPKTLSPVNPKDRSQTTVDCYQNSLDQNIWPYLEHKSSCFYTTTTNNNNTKSTMSTEEHSLNPARSHISVTSDSQATNESLSQTLSGHTTPHDSISKAHSNEHTLRHILSENESAQAPKCHCDPAVAKITDPHVGKELMEKLNEQIARHGTEHKETSTAAALRKHVTECLKIMTSSVNLSDKSHSGTWKAEVNRKPIVHQISGQSDLTSLTLTVELPLKDILNSVSSASSTIGVYSDSRCEVNRSYTSEIPRNSRSDHRHSLPGHTHRSILFKATGEYVDVGGEDAAIRAKTLEDSMSESYLTSLGDLESMPDGQLDWNKVAELEQALWKEHEDPKVSTFVRQGSLMTYVRIMKDILKGCEKKSERLVDDANQFYEAHQAQLSSAQLQRLAHLRLLIQDTKQQIKLVEKMLDPPDLFSSKLKEEELIRKKRWPLSTPIRSRERYARLTRVIIEMLAMSEELLENLKNPGANSEMPLFI
ncbi:unnamed protein product [Echinostoma caproni]|uniref:ASD2 domain-containing protein n=1 Tax=Echinostoma caproni TaxID=27848 RepID=A0A183ACS1_9TREM|nr:unnamed protein product [Echinostoma caproni]